MSFINNAHPGSQINLLCLIFRVIYENSNKFTVDDLQNYCATKSLFNSDDQKKRFRENLSFWLDSPHKLWTTDAEGKLELDLPCEASGHTPAEVAHQLRHRLMKVDFNNILAEEDQFGASKAIRSFSYILTQDQYVIFRDELSSDNIDSSFASNFGRFSLNNSEKSYFVEFCNFLGLSELFGKKEHIDPTRLVKSFLDSVFVTDNELPANEFLSRLSNLIPIIDNGKYNLIIREAIGAEIDMPNSLSINLSHALNRLDEEHILNFTKRSDDIDAITLNLPNDTTKQVSVVAYKRANNHA